MGIKQQSAARVLAGALSAVIHAGIEGGVPKDEIARQLVDEARRVLIEFQAEHPRAGLALAIAAIEEVEAELLGRKPN